MPLRAELERKHGLVSRSTTDTEIIPAGYLAWGTDLFDRLEGIFAIALWDRQQQQLVLARAHAASRGACADVSACGGGCDSARGRAH